MVIEVKNSHKLKICSDHLLSIGGKKKSISYSVFTSQPSAMLPL